MVCRAFFKFCLRRDNLQRRRRQNFPPAKTRQNRLNILKCVFLVNYCKAIILSFNKCKCCQFENTHIRSSTTLFDSIQEALRGVADFKLSKHRVNRNLRQNYKCMLSCVHKTCSFYAFTSRSNLK